MSVVANVAINVDASKALQQINGLNAAASKLAQDFSGLGQKIGTGLQGVGEKIKGIGSAMTSLGSIAAGIGAGALVKGFGEAGIAAERTGKTIKALAGSYGEVAGVNKIATDAAKQFGIGQTTASKAVADLYGRLRPMGVSLEDIGTTYSAVNKAALMMNLSTYDSKEAFRQLGQAMGSGRLQGDELRSLMERMPAIGQAVAKVMGVTVGELKELGADGAITTDIIIKAMGELNKLQPPPPDAFRLITAAMEDLSTSIGKQLLPIMTPLAQKLTELATKFEELKVGETLGQALMPLANVLLSLVDGFLKLDPGLQKAIIQFAAIGTAIALVVVPAGIVVGAIGSIVSAIGGLITALSGGALGAAFSAIVAFLTGPVGIAVALVALGALIWTFRDEIANFFEWLGAEIWKLLTTLFSIDQPILDWFKGLWENIIGLAQAYINIVGQVWQKIFDFFVEYAVKPIQKAWDALITYLGNAIDKAASAIGNAWESIVKFFESKVIKPIEKGWDALIKFLSDAASKAGSAISSAWSTIVSFFTNNVVKPLQNAWNAYIEFIRNSMAKIGGFFKDTWSSLVTFFEGRVSKPIANEFQFLLKTAQSIAPGIAAAFRKGFEGVTEFAKGVINSLIGLFEKWVNSAIKSINYLIDKVNSLPGISIKGIGEITLPRLAGGGYATPGGLQAFAEGGMVSQGTLAIVGEAGPEYIIPEGKMLQASMNYLNGMRGQSVIPEFAAGGFVGAPQINVQTGPVMQQNGQNYVTIDDMQRAMRETATSVIKTLRTPSARYGLGIS